MDGTSKKTEKKKKSPQNDPKSLQNKIIFFPILKIVIVSIHTYCRALLFQAFLKYVAPLKKTKSKSRFELSLSASLGEKNINMTVRTEMKADGTDLSVLDL